MGRQICQALRTYVGQRHLWLVVGLLFAPMIVMTAMFGTSPPQSRTVELMPILFASTFVGMMIGGHVKTQFANPRARLVPRFSAPHLAAAAMVIALAVAVQWWMIASAAGALCPGIPGFALLAIALGAWCSYLGRILWYCLLPIIVVTAPFAPRSIMVLFEASLRGDNLPVTVGVLYAAVMGLIVLGHRLHTLSEERPAYSDQIGSSAPGFTWPSASVASTRERRRWESQTSIWTGIPGWWRDLQFRLIFGRGAARGAPRRLLLHQLASRFVWLFSGLYGAAFAFCFMWSKSSLPGIPSTDDAWLVWIFPVTLTASSVVGKWLRRRPDLARESLFPMTREDFVRGLLRSRALDVAVVTAFHLSAILLAAILSHSTWSAPEIVAPYLAITLAQYLVMGSMALWLLGSHSYFDVILGELVCIASSYLIITEILVEERLPWFASVVAIVAASVVLASWFYWLAFRSWCQVDLD